MIDEQAHLCKWCPPDDDFDVLVAGRRPHLGQLGELGRRPHGSLLPAHAHDLGCDENKLRTIIFSLSTVTDYSGIVIGT